MSKKKIAILTGGGDAPGLNAVIYALARTSILKYNYDVIGYKFGYRGLYNNDYIPLTLDNTSGILYKGGTIIYSSNKDNLFDYTVTENGQKIKKDVSDIAIRNLEKEGVDCLAVLGGDGTLTSARDFARKGVNVIGIPKTIDNDLGATETTYGFQTAVDIVTEALARLHTTAESHHRVIVVEVMGRSAGWIALTSGMAGSADVILVPEVPFTIDKIIEKIKERDAKGKRFSIIVVCEGAKELGGQTIVDKVVDDSPDPIRFGGIAKYISDRIETILRAGDPEADHEVRSVVLGHTQRGGNTSAFDRVLSLRYGAKAVELIHNEQFGNMVCLKDSKMSFVSLEDVIGSNKYIDPDNCELMDIARNLGISFGD